MLSPASLRLCCLAVMAPALTKADRRADCLPVVLSDPFCDSKTVSYNRKDKIGELDLPKLSNKVASLFHKKRPFMQRAWIRTCIRNSTEIPLKSGFSAFDLRKSLLSCKVNAETKSKSWHSANATLAVADKVRLKYTMNKSSSARNMGLARTNASLGLHSMKKLNRITQFTPKEKGNASTQEQDKKASDLVNQTILTAVTSVSELSYGDVTSSSGDLVTCCTPPQETISDPESVKSNVSISSDVCDSLVNNSLSTLKEPDLPISPPVTLIGSDYVFNSVKNVEDVNKEENDIHLCNSVEPAISLEATILKDKAADLVDSPVNTPTLSSSPEEEKAELSTLDNDTGGSVCNNFESTSPIHEVSAVNFVTFPDSFLENNSAESGEPAELADSFQPAEEEVSSDIKSNSCCLVSFSDVSSLQDKFALCEENLIKALKHCELVFQQNFVLHVDKEISRFVAHYQNKLSIPCQKQSRSSQQKSMKDAVDLKAELLQKEDVKNLSTSALVSLVRKLETSGSPGGLSNLNQQSLEAEDIKSNREQVDLEEVTNLKKTCGILLNGLKNLVQNVDPELTESSDEEDCVQIKDDNLMKLVLKFGKQRASLSKKYDWLLGRMHELENQQRTVCDVLEKISSIKDLDFEEHSSSIADCTDAILKTPTKHTNVSSTLPLNGCLDHSSLLLPNSTLSEPLLMEQTSNSSNQSEDESCIRTRAMQTSIFKKRKLLIPTGLHLTNSKFAKLSTVNCNCNSNDELLPCVLCMGRYSCIKSLDPDSMALPDRIALLEKSFHPVLSFDKDIPISVHLENLLKQNEAKYQIVSPASPIPNNRIMHLETNHKSFSDARSRSRKLNRYARSLLSAKYCNKKRLRKHKLVFGKWRRLQNKSFHARERDRMRRVSVASSNSSRDSPIPSPVSFYDDGSGIDRKRHDDTQFDIDDVIIPYSSKRGRLVKFEFKDIVIPNWRCRHFSSLQPCEDDAKEEDISEESCIRRHERCEIEERKILRKGTLAGLSGTGALQKRSRRHRSDSRADSSGANTPDPVLFYDQDIFQNRQDSMMANSPLSPVLSPPTTPSSANLVSDDSQPAFGSRPASLERRKLVAKKLTDENIRSLTSECDEVSPYEQFTFPLSDAIYDNLLAMSDHNNCEDTDVTMSGPSCPASPTSTTSSTSTLEDDDDDPEWTVVRRESEQHSLVLKLAKR